MRKTVLIISVLLICWGNTAMKQSYAVQNSLHPAPLLLADGDDPIDPPLPPPKPIKIPIPGGKA